MCYNVTSVYNILEMYIKYYKSQSLFVIIEQYIFNEITIKW